MFFFFWYTKNKTFTSNSSDLFLFLETGFWMVLAVSVQRLEFVGCPNYRLVDLVAEFLSHTCSEARRFELVLAVIEYL